MSDARTSEAQQRRIEELIAALETLDDPHAREPAKELLQVVLADQLADNVATLAAVNETLPAGSSSGRERAGRRRRGRIPYIFIAPGDRLEIGRLAREVYKRHYAGIGGLLPDTDLALFGRIVNAERSAIHGELLSYLFLAREFIDELIALGRRDAERWLDTQHDAGLWQIGRLPGSTAESPPAPGRPRKRRSVQDQLRELSPAHVALVGIVGTLDSYGDNDRDGNAADGAATATIATK